MDNAGWDLLKRLAARGCRLHASGAYNSYIVRTLQPVSRQRTNAIGDQAGKKR